MGMNAISPGCIALGDETPPCLQAALNPGSAHLQGRHNRTALGAEEPCDLGLSLPHVLEAHASETLARPSQDSTRPPPFLCPAPQQVIV